MGFRTYASRLAAGFLLLVTAIEAAGPPKRIISTAPSITEILFALGLGDRVVGVTQYCRYPKEVALAILIPDHSMPTKEARKALPDTYSKADAIHNTGRAALFVAAMGSGRVDLLDAASLVAP